MSSSPFSRASSAQARRSVMFIMGLLGVSMYSARVWGRSCSRMHCTCVVSAKLTSSPFLLPTVRISRMTPPYRSSEQMMWSPGPNSSKHALTAAMPDANATVSHAPSSADTVSSRRCRVGFFSRV